MTHLKVDLRRRSGWFRVWAIAALCWIAFAVSQISPPWDIAQIEVQRRAIEAGQDNGQAIAKVNAEIANGEIAGSDRNGCEPGTLKSNIFERWTNLDDWLRNRERVRAGERSRQPLEIRVLCEPTGRAMEQWATALAFVLGPPLLVPLGMWLVGQLGFWIVAGFRPGQSDPAISPAAKMSVVRTPSLARAASQKAELQGSPEIALQAATLRSWLSWSVLIAAAIDIFARASVSGGKSHGTNLLLFAIAAFAAYFIAKLLQRLRRSSIDLPFAGLSIFWVAALALISFTTGRY